MLMDVRTVLWYEGGFHGGLYLSALAAVLPDTVLYVLSNAVFLWLLGKPFEQQPERIRYQYGV